MQFAQLRELPACTDVPAIFMTADTAPDSVAELRALGAIAVMAKPIDPARFVDQLRAAFESR